MQLEEELMKQLGAKNERSRDRRENTLYSLLDDPRTPRLDLDNASKMYNRLQAKKQWEDFAQNEINCAPLWAGIWAEWRDGNMRDARVGCALIIVPDEAAYELPGMERLQVGWQLIAQPVCTVPNRTFVILPLDILILINESGAPLARFALPDDEDADYSKAMQLFNFGSNLLLTTLLGVSRVHEGAAKQSKDGRVLLA